VRTAITQSWRDVPMVEDDWVNIIDAPVWATPRDGLVGETPVIGRHSRGHWSKWPDTREDLLAAYPDDPRYRVRVLGGTEAPEEILGGLPQTWTSLPFGSVPVPRFLAGIDFLVYFHHPGLVEAFGRVVLEGLAAGAVCIVPPQMEQVFGDACVYGTPQDVTGIVDRLSTDPVALATQRERGLRAVHERFSYEAHLDRLAAFAGAPTGAPAALGAQGTGTATALLVAPADTEQDTVAEAVAWMRETLTQVPVVVTADHDLDLAGADAAGEGPDSTRAGSVSAHTDRFPTAVDSGPVDAGRIAHLARAHRAARVLVLDGQPAGASAAELVSRLGDDVDAELLRRDSGAWRAEPLERRREVASGATAAVRRTVGRVVGGARRHTPQWARPAAQRAYAAAGEVRAWTARRAGGPGPVPPVFTHVAPDAPVSLLVVTGADVDPESTLDAVLAAVQITSRFRPAILAPRSWVTAASERGVFIASMIPVHQWDARRAVRWTDYLDVRLEETARRTGAAVVTVLDRTLVPGEPDPVLTALTATRTRR
jgi:hypothetical protein